MLSVMLSAMLTGAFVPDPTPPPVITQSSGTRRYVPKVDRSAPRQTEGAGSR
jgi:hypothetical protein